MDPRSVLADVTSFDVPNGDIIELRSFEAQYYARLQQRKEIEMRIEEEREKLQQLSTVEGQKAFVAYCRNRDVDNFLDGKLLDEKTRSELEELQANIRIGTGYFFVSALPFSGVLWAFFGQLPGCSQLYCLPFLAWAVAFIGLPLASEMAGRRSFWLRQLYQPH